MSESKQQPVTDETFIEGYKVGTKFYGTIAEANKGIARGEGDSWIPLYRKHHCAPELVEALQATTRAASDTLFVLRDILRNDGGADPRLENLADALDEATDLGWPALAKAGA